MDSEKKVKMKKKKGEGSFREGKEKIEEKQEGFSQYFTRVHCLYSLLYKTPGTMYTLSYIVFILFTSALFCCCLIYSQHYGRLSCIRKRERKKNTKNIILNINVAGRNN